MVGLKQVLHHNNKINFLVDKKIHTKISKLAKKIAG